MEIDAGLGIDADLAGDAEEIPATPNVASVVNATPRSARLITFFITLSSLIECLE
jgi:hypothetical protein